DRQCRRRRAVRPRQPRRQAAGVDRAVGRPAADLLQLQAQRAARLFVRQHRAALSVRLRPQLHHLRDVRAAPGARLDRHGPERPGLGRRSQHRPRQGRRGGAAVHPRRPGLGHPS
ncbi:hypothetical protein LTR94_034517, partial [Friedmanniomyces endolithicus]